MNELEIGLSKKSKIIEISSVEKKVTALQSWGFFVKNPEIPGFSYN